MNCSKTKISFKLCFSPSEYDTSRGSRHFYLNVERVLEKLLYVLVISDLKITIDIWYAYMHNLHS